MSSLTDDLAGDKGKKKEKRPYLQESLELQIILFIVMFLDGSYYVALSQTIITVTKSIQFGLYIT